MLRVTCMQTCLLVCSHTFCPFSPWFLVLSPIPCCSSLWMTLCKAGKEGQVPRAYGTPRGDNCVPVCIHSTVCLIVCGVLALCKIGKCLYVTLWIFFWIYVYFQQDLYLCVYIFVSVDDSGKCVYSVTGSCGPSLHKCMSVYVRACVCTYVYSSYVYGSRVWSPQEGRVAPLPTEAMAWGGAGPDWTESLSH